MSEGFASPSSFRLELEARRRHAAAPPRGLGDLAPAVALSGLPQAFDLFIGAFAAAVVFPAVLFPTLDRQAAMLAGLGVWSLAYAVIPAGRALAAAVRGRFGAGVTVTAARFGLGAATAAIAFLPDFASAGLLAVAALLACRLAQGVALGGVADEGRAFRELADAGGVWGQAARAAPVFLGLAIAAALLGVLNALSSSEDMLSWGWRLPFVLAVPMNVVALFAQLRLLTTENSRAAAPGRPMMRLASTRL